MSMRSHPFLIALRFLTRIPAGNDGAADAAAIGRSLIYYPLVGLILGLILAALRWSLDATPGLLSAALLLAAWVLLTGALHLDGLADSADAWIGGRGNRRRTLAIMKDPHCGPAAVIALVLILLIKFAALQSLESGDWLVVVFVPTLARSTVVLLFLTTPYVRRGGLGTALARDPPKAAGAIAITATWIAALLLIGWNASWLLLAVGGTFCLWRRAIINRLGGTTGDTAGALIELAETAALVVVAFAH